MELEGKPSAALFGSARLFSPLHQMDGEPDDLDSLGPPTRPEVHLISSPAAVLHHWRETTTSYLAVPAKSVLCTSKAAEVTSSSLRGARVIILTRDCITNLFKSCHKWVEEHHQIQLPNGGARWVGP